MLRASSNEPQMRYLNINTLKVGATSSAILTKSAGAS